MPNVEVFDLFLMICVGPTTLFLGVVGTVVTLRSLGWLEPGGREPGHANPGIGDGHMTELIPDYKTVRMEATKLPELLAQERLLGWRPDGMPQMDGLMTVRFVRWVRVARIESLN